MMLWKFHFIVIFMYTTLIMIVLFKIPYKYDRIRKNKKEKKIDRKKRQKKEKRRKRRKIKKNGGVSVMGNLELESAVFGKSTSGVQGRNTLVVNKNDGAKNLLLLPTKDATVSNNPAERGSDSMSDLLSP